MIQENIINMIIVRIIFNKYPKKKNVRKINQEGINIL